ncbi:LysE family translocator [Rhodoferax sp.]|uniref:LysE family translocator n=1 Tax=Rhodoferax sp. TaxID=50421 RepID=UPI00374D700A
MNTLTTLFGILAVLSIGMVSPGPSFVLVARTAIGSSRAAGVASAIGMAAGACVLCVVALLGLHALLQQVPLAYWGLKLVGGVYLLYLGFKIWQGAKTPLVLADAAPLTRAGLLRHFLIGAGTMLSNPKAAVVYGVIFAALLPHTPSLSLSLALPPSVFLLEGSWYLLVALALSSARPRQKYLQAKTAIDRATGAVLGLLGIKLLLSSR